MRSILNCSWPSETEYLLPRIVFVLAMMTTIKSAVWPWFPAVPDCLWLGNLFTEPPWNAVADWPYAQLRFHPFVIGLSYIVPLDTLFSLWFFGWSIKAILAIFVFASIVGLGFALRNTYEWGFANCPEAVRIKAAQEWSFTGPTNVPEANWRVFAFSGVGVVIGIIMMVLKAMFIWWPFDPVAMGVAYSNEWVYWYAASFFVTWLIKAGALRYGGAKTYKDLYPVFLGMAAGYILYVAVISIFNLPGGWSVASMA